MLTQRQIDRAKKGKHGDGNGLYLVVQNSRNKSWVYRWEHDGRERSMGLGPLHTVDVKLARTKAREARLLRLEGRDPLEARRAAKAAHALEVAKSRTFKQCAEDYIAENRAGWRNAKHGRQWTVTLQTYVYPKIGHLPIAAIDTGLVLQCIKPDWQRATETMSRVRGRIESILDWAAVYKYRTGDNPARWSGLLEHVLPAKAKIAKHHPALPYAELPAFMATLRAREGVAARALEFLILTAARTGEVRGAQWSEFDLAAKQWTVPAGRMKGGVEHRVALSQHAIELLQGLPAESGNSHVFIGPHAGSGLSATAMVQVLHRMGRDDVSVHGFRSTFRDWAAEQTNYPREVCELALAHKVAGKTERAYQRGDQLKKRFLLAEAWARYCSSPPAAKADVVPMHARATP